MLSMSAFMGAVEESVKLLEHLRAQKWRKRIGYEGKHCPHGTGLHLVRPSSIQQVLLQHNLVDGGAGSHSVESCLPGVCTVLDVLVGTGVRKIWWDQIVEELEYQNGFPDGSVGKEAACNTGDPSSIAGWGRSAGERIGYPFQYSWASLWLSW